MRANMPKTRYIVAFLFSLFHYGLTGQESPAKPNSNSTKNQRSAEGPLNLPDKENERIVSLEAEIDKLMRKGIAGDDITEQNSAISTAIEFANDILATRIRYQGHAWRDSKGIISEWWEISEANWNLKTLNLMKEMDSANRKKLAEATTCRENAIKANADIRYDVALQNLREELR